MPRQARLDYPEAIHYVRVSGRRGASLLFDEEMLRNSSEGRVEPVPDIRRFEFLVARACAEFGGIVHGYSWLPNTAILVIQRFDAPLELIMGAVFGQYSRYLHSVGRIPRNQAVYGSRYESKVVAPMYLAYAVRRAHRSPVDAGLCRSPSDYQLSSERVYTGMVRAPWLTTSPVQAALQQRGYGSAAGYHEFMERDESEHVAQLFALGSKWDRRVVGDRAFVQSVTWKAAHAPSTPSRDELIDSVADLLGRQSVPVYERDPVGVLGRALVAWHATRSGAATLSEVGRWFSRSASTLRREIDRYKAVEPALFSLSTEDLLRSGAVRRSSAPQGLTAASVARTERAD